MTPPCLLWSLRNIRALLFDMSPFLFSSEEFPLFLLFGPEIVIGSNTRCLLWSLRNIRALLFKMPQFLFSSEEFPLFLLFGPEIVIGSNARCLLWSLRNIRALLFKMRPFLYSNFSDTSRINLYRNSEEPFGQHIYTRSLPTVKFKEHTRSTLPDTVIYIFFPKCSSVVTHAAFCEV